jgi:hypothetical protein
MRRWWQTASYWILTWIQWLSALAIILLGAIPRDLTKLPPIVLQVLGKPLTAAQHWSWLVIPLAVLAGLVKLLREKLGSPWMWDLVKNVLDTLRDVTYSETVQPDEPTEYHRATLFKRVRFCVSTRCLLFRKWPFSGWLLTVERSGHFTLRQREAFWAPDKGELAYGVCGRTLAIQRVLPIVDLPDPADPANIEEYARRSFVTVEWARKTGERARSYIGIPIEVRGKPWGVVILDSRHPRPPGAIETIDGKIQVTAAVSRAYSTAARALGKILEPH